MSSAAENIKTVLSRISNLGGAPALTWYHTDFERVELSGSTLTNWITKITNFLVEEYDFGTGENCYLDLPSHWRTTIWTLAVWQTGATLVSSPAEATIVVTSDPSSFHNREETSAEVVAISLAPLALKFTGDLPAGYIDGAATIMSFSDHLGYLPALDPDSAAFAGFEVPGYPETTVSHTQLISVADAVAGRIKPDSRVLVASLPLHLETTLKLVSCWKAGGSVVLLSVEHEAELQASTELKARLLANEVVTEECLS